MNSPELQNGLATFLAAYLRRWMATNVYDKIPETALGRRAGELDTNARYGIEFALNALTAFLDQRLIADTPLFSLIKQVALDTAPEVSKRLINDARHQLEQAPQTAEQRALISDLLSLEDDALFSLLQWLTSLTREKRRDLVTQFQGLSPEELTRLVGLPHEHRDALSTLLSHEPARVEPGGAAARLHGRWEAFNARLRDTVERRKRKLP